MFSIYHWDTFDNETFLVRAGFETIEAAETYARQHYGERLGLPHGADRVDIVDEKSRTLVRQYPVG